MRFILIVCLFALLVGAAYAQQSQPASVALDFSNVDVAQALSALSTKANVNILGDSTVKGTVSCSLSGVTAEQALDTICKMNKLEWYKTYTTATTSIDDKATASKLFKLLDALKDLGGSAVICSDPKTQTQTVFIPNAGAKSLDTSTVATDLKLKSIYIVRAIPDPAKLQADKAKTDASKTALGNPANTDPKTAAGQLVGYLQQMPMDQQLQTMSEMRHQMFDNMTPEQRDQVRQYFQQNGGWRGGGNRGPGGQGGQGGQPGQGQAQGGGHHHSNTGQ
jgi:hypothetical protein